MKRKAPSESPKIGRPFSKSNKTGRPLSGAERQRRYQARHDAHVRDLERRVALSDGSRGATTISSSDDTKRAPIVSVRHSTSWTEETIDDALTKVRRIIDQAVTDLVKLVPR